MGKKESSETRLDSDGTPYYKIDGRQVSGVVLATTCYHDVDPNLSKQTLFI